MLMVLFNDKVVVAIEFCLDADLVVLEIFFLYIWEIGVKGLDEILR